MTKPPGAFGAYTRVAYTTDFSEHTLSEAARHLGCMPEEMTVYCNPGNAPLAQLLRDKYRCTVILFPPDIMGDAWAVNYKDQWVWSPGI